MVSTNLSIVTYTLCCRSPEAVDLAKIIKKLGPISDVCMEDYIINFFSEFNMQNQCIY